jgi:hypothetical protein
LKALKQAALHASLARALDADSDLRQDQALERKRDPC